MSKYIIKNCPNYLPEFFYLGSCKCEKGSSKNCKYIDNCKDISDCLLKQIVELCKQFDKPIYKSETKYFYLKNPLADEILKLLEIEEVNE